MEMKRGANLPPWCVPVSIGLGAALLSAMAVVWLAGEPAQSPSAPPAEVTPERATRDAAPNPTTAEKDVEPTPELANFKLQPTGAGGSVDLMLGAFPSTVDIVSTKIVLERQGYKPIERAHRRSGPPGTPAFELDTLQVDGYQHLDQAGVLTLNFFNNQLYEAEFEPADAEGYRSAVRARLPKMKRGKTGRTEGVVGRLRVSSSLDLAVSEVGQSLKTRPYVLWQDLRLVAERDDWDRKNGTQPPPTP